MGSRWERCKAVACLLGLSACETGTAGRLIAQQTPAVRSVNGGSAELTLLACPIAGDDASTEAMLHRLVTMLETSGLLVAADSGSAKLSIDLCP
jgi:hypothetical protein